jgi:hypothetical protein
VKLAAAVVLILAGAVWILQGLDVAFAPQSVMTGDRSWVVWGAVAVAVGAGLIWWERRLR